jgi:hypothetical protein
MQSPKFLSTWCGAAGLVAALVLGAALRFIWVRDIEYKWDEAWTFQRTQEVGRTEPFPWVGMPTSAGFPNPGMSVWVFLVLAKLSGAHDPLALARAIQVGNVLALVLLVGFACRVVPRPEREPWLWAAALVAVNPLAVLFHRKIWPPSVLPLFTLALLTGWWHRDRRWGAFLWGLVGACVGQVHLSGFFFAAGVAGWAFLFDRPRVAWRSWLGGSVLGALPLLPWLHALAAGGPAGTVHHHWAHVLEGKFWVRWLGEPFGLSVEYALEDDFGDFLSCPHIGGQPTYLVAVVHGLVVVLAGAVLVRAAWLIWRQRRQGRDFWLGKGSPTAFTLAAAFGGFGICLTASGMPIPRHYLLILFPLGFVWLARAVLVQPGRPGDVWGWGRGCLAGLWLAQLLITVSFLGYVHVNQRPIRGDYGIPYGALERYRRLGPARYIQTRPQAAAGTGLH